MNAYGMLPVVIIKPKTESLCLEKNLICQCKNMTPIDTTMKNEIISEANCYEIITDKITQRRVAVAQFKCLNQLGNGMSN